MIKIDERHEMINNHLSDVSVRVPDNREDSAIAHQLETLKQQAVDSENEELAKLLWCLQSVQECQNTFIRAFYDMKAGHFFRAWCALEQVEVILNVLGRHFDLDVSGNDAYMLRLIRKHTKQFQSLFPYRLFFSLGAVVFEKKCSICDQLTSLRNPCPHQVGQIYYGRLCSREITKAALVEVSIVEQPVHKYAVAFLLDKDSEKATDTYNYKHIHYAVQCLPHPFSKWKLAARRLTRPTSDFDYVGEYDECPCGSTRAFAECCRDKQYLMRNQLQVIVEQPPDAQIPAVVDFGAVRGIPLRPLEASSTAIA